MGLGNTIQSLSLLMDLSMVFGHHHLENWIGEIKEWTDFVPAALYGRREDRQIIIRKCIFHPKDKNKVIFNILVIRINIVHNVLPLLQKIRFHYLIIDETHRLKSIETKVYGDVCSLHFDHCTFLTGTPVQNDMSELWALLCFLDRKEFPTF